MLSVVGVDGVVGWGVEDAWPRVWRNGMSWAWRRLCVGVVVEGFAQVRGIADVVVHGLCVEGSRLVDLSWRGRDVGGNGAMDVDAAGGVEFCVDGVLPCLLDGRRRVAGGDAGGVGASSRFCGSSACGEGEGVAGDNGESVGVVAPEEGGDGSVWEA